MTMIKDTIISAFNYDGTLLKWLKKVEDALQNASASEFRVNKKGNATISFSIVFANGDILESGDIILQQGESVTNATIRQGHLILTLSNGDELDAGDLGAVTGFSINESQHLIVTYQNGTTQDLGAIFNGATIKVNTLTSDNPEISTLKPVVEVMTGYSATLGTNAAFTITNVYHGIVKNGNKLTLVSAVKLTRTATATVNLQIASFTIPSNIGNKLYPVPIGGYNWGLAYMPISAMSTIQTGVTQNAYIEKEDNTTLRIFLLNAATLNTLEEGVEYYVRIEATFLLSENLAQ